MNWFKKLFAKKSNYAPQVLDTKITDILDRLDTYLTDFSAVVPEGSTMVIKAYKIGLFNTVLPMKTVCKQLLDMLPEDFVYIPRSIAFACEADGTWCFYVAYREQGYMDIDKAEMFIHLLNRTNDAR